MVLQCSVHSFLTSSESQSMDRYQCESKMVLTQCLTRYGFAAQAAKTEKPVQTLKSKEGPAKRTNLLLSVRRQPPKHLVDGPVDIIQKRRRRVRLHEQPSQSIVERVDAREGQETSDGNRKQVRDQSN